MSKTTKNRWPLGIVLVIAAVPGGDAQRDGVSDDAGCEPGDGQVLREGTRVPDADQGHGADAGARAAMRASSSAPGAIIVQYPRSMASMAGEGHVLLYRPSDRSADRSMPIVADSAAQQVDSVHDISRPACGASRSSGPCAARTTIWNNPSWCRDGSPRRD